MGLGLSPHLLLDPGGIKEGLGGHNGAGVDASGQQQAQGTYQGEVG